MKSTSRRLKRGRVDEEQDSVLHGIDDESEIERVARQLRRQRHAHRFHTVMEMQRTSPQSSSAQELVPTLCVWSRSRHTASTENSL